MISKWYRMLLLSSKISPKSESDLILVMQYLRFFTKYNSKID